VNEQLQELPMNYPDRNGTSNQNGPGEAENTLRLIARLPAPAGLEDRVHAGLRSGPRHRKVLAWPVAEASSWMRAAAAAAIVFVVAGGGWGIYSRVEPGQPARGIAGPRLAAPGGFTEGGAVRRPQTLVGPAVAPPATRPAAATAPKPKTPLKAAATPAVKSKAGTIVAAPPASPPVQ
jgi:hypothetical protein